MAAEATTAVAKLNALLADDPVKLASIAAAVNAPGAYEIVPGPAPLGFAPCKISLLSRDSRGRAQKMVRFGETSRVNFRPWHVAWIHRVRIPIPAGLQYSHRCNNENCIEPTHGRWETDEYNKARWSCRAASHVLTPGEAGIVCYRTCPHSPCCLVPKVVGAPTAVPVVEDPDVDVLRM